MTPRARIALVVSGLVVLVVAFVIASGSSDTSKRQDGTNAGATAPAATATAEAGTTTAETATTTAAQAPAAPAVPVIKVVGAKPQGGVQRLKFTKGDTIKFRVVSDTADEIHVHGYDVHKDVAAGGSVTFTIPAKIEGRFVVELENHATQIAEIEVDPS
jgi:FtsP/CotA-like multicopper oxidase with cupredoxin domain